MHCFQDVCEFYKCETIKTARLLVVPGGGGGSPVRIPKSYQCYPHVGNMTGCHADLYTVSRCCTRGESEEWCTGKRTCKWEIRPVCGHPVTRNKTGVSVAQQKGVMSSKKKTALRKRHSNSPYLWICLSVYINVLVLKNFCLISQVFLN